MDEIARLKDHGATYLYFIDGIFLPWRQLLEALEAEGLAFGVQTRLDIWKPEMIERLGRAGRVPIEGGVGSITEAGRAALDKDCRVPSDELTEKLPIARRHVPFVKANLIEVAADEATDLRRWRDRMRGAGVWANDPVPLFPCPSSPDSLKPFGPPDDRAGERAHDHCLRQFARFGDIQDARPPPLAVLEGGVPASGACC
jgi:hypothetical protein